MRQAHWNEAGSVAIVVALCMILFLGMVAIVADLGLLFLEKTRLSNGVDAAALAGVQELPLHKQEAATVVNNYLAENLADLSFHEVSISPDSKEIRVRARKKVTFALAPLLGITSREVEAAARARTDIVSAMTGVVPLAVVRQDFSFGEQYLLKYGPGQGGGSYYHGNFGGLALGGHGGRVYMVNLANGFNGVLRIGDLVQTEPGNMSGPTAEGVRARIEACTHSNSTYDNVAKGCERLVIVPIVESLDVNGRKEVKIVGFGAFFLESTSRRGNDSFIVGRFIRYAAQGEIGSGEDFGLKAAKLIQ